jgi:chromosome partitioning protein
MLDRIASHYDLVILDCPPSLSLLNVNAIVAAEAIVVPVTPQPLATEALETLLSTIERIRARMTLRAKTVGIVLSAVDPAGKHSREVAERLRAEHRDLVFHTEIRLAATLTDAPTARKPVSTLAPKSPSADAFRRLAGEVLQRLQTAKR